MANHLKNLNNNHRRKAAGTDLPKGGESFLVLIKLVVASIEFFQGKWIIKSLPFRNQKDIIYSFLTDKRYTATFVSSPL